MLTKCAPCVENVFRCYVTVLSRPHCVYNTMGPYKLFPKLFNDCIICRGLHSRISWTIWCCVGNVNERSCLFQSVLK